MNDKEIDFSIFYNFLKNYIKLILILFAILFSLAYLSKSYIFNYASKKEVSYLNFKIYPITSSEVSLYSKHNAIIDDVTKINSANIEFFERIIFEFERDNLDVWITESSAQQMDIDTEVFYKLITKENLFDNFYEYLLHPYKINGNEKIEDFIQSWDLQFSKNLEYLEVTVPLSNPLINNNYIQDQKNTIFEALELVRLKVIDDIRFRSKIFLEIHKKRIDRSKALTEFYFKNNKLSENDVYTKVAIYNDLNKELLNIYFDDLDSTLENNEKFRVVSYNKNLSYKLIQNPIKNYFSIIIFITSLCIAILLSALTALIRNYIVK